jgi:hypothetical protein
MAELLSIFCLLGLSLRTLLVEAEYSLPIAYLFLLNAPEGKVILNGPAWRGQNESVPGSGKAPVWKNLPILP